ncbi:MAG: glucose-6-phosphate dehydrogenase, partial [Methylobacter sp.]|nr:glucose-6-phosphate dehydrogenase [Methylobacter sp.]
MNDKTIYKPCDLVLFGALGDLSRRMLLISLYKLEEANLLEPDTHVIGVDRIAQDNA